METENLHVVYYVNKDFRNEYKGVSLQKVEKSVEEDYVSNIRNNCWKERQQSKFGNMPNFMKACVTIKKDGLRQESSACTIKIPECERKCKVPYCFSLLKVSPVSLNFCVLLSDLTIFCKSSAILTCYSIICDHFSENEGLQ